MRNHRNPQMEKEMKDDDDRRQERSNRAGAVTRRAVTERGFGSGVEESE